MIRISRKLTGIAGLLAGVIPLFTIFMAISLSPWFSFTGNFLSELGGDVSSAVIFNAGLMAGGALGTLFAWGILVRREYSCQAGLKIFMAATASLFFVGFFPLTADLWHTAPSVSFFACSTVSMVMIGWSGRKGLLGKGILIMGLVSLAAAPLYAVPRPYGFNAVTELVTSLAVAAFVLATSIRMLTEK